MERMDPSVTHWDDTLLGYWDDKKGSAGMTGEKTTWMTRKGHWDNRRRR
ncbi:MAG: hypothetical protein ACR5K3_00925 [Wolbachia sp.]